jgi:hypothetical protein
MSNILLTSNQLVKALQYNTTGAVGVVGSGVTKAFVAGITSSIVTGGAVYVTPHGQLGVLASAERALTDQIRQLRNRLAEVSELNGQLASARPLRATSAAVDGADSVARLWRPLPNF